MKKVIGKNSSAILDCLKYFTEKIGIISNEQKLPNNLNYSKRSHCYGMYRFLVLSQYAINADNISKCFRKELVRTSWATPIAVILWHIYYTFVIKGNRGLIVIIFVPTILCQYKTTFRKFFQYFIQGWPHTNHEEVLD